jgi:hypothetical protein
MAKRAPILPEGYNPVGEALRRAVSPHHQIELSRPQAEANIVELRKDQHRVGEVPQVEGASPPAVILKERTPVPEIPTERELKLTSFRFRCTENERRKWHSMAQELTGEHSQLSHFARAAFMLIENSFDDLKHFAPDIQRLKYPAKTDHIALALYEQRIAEFLFDAIKAAGRPRG